MKKHQMITSELNETECPNMWIDWLYYFNGLSKQQALELATASTKNNDIDVARLYLMEWRSWRES